VPDIDQKANSVFAGKVVRKDLVRKVKEGANIPVFVLEYLLGKYCATDDPAAIEAGLRVVDATVAENCVSPEESNKIQSRVREKGKYSLIDKVKVTYHSSEDKYWAELVNFGHKHVHVPDHFVRDYERLLAGGIWAQIDLRHEYVEDGPGKKSPFWIDDIQPIQLARFSIEDYMKSREEFTTDEWIDFLIRSIGMEPAHFDRRVKMLFLQRLVPLCEANYNLVELGPRETGKSYAYQQVSPYAILLTGPTSVANLFYNIGSGKIGLVGLWDAVAFDEVGDLQKMPKEVVTTLKTYCESGAFARGKESLTGIASIAMFGNMDQPLKTLLVESHLFAPMPDVIRSDMAFLDRIHYYLPGWEIPKMKTEHFTNHFGLVVDYLAEAMHELRRYNYTEALDRTFKLGAGLKSRDVKAVRKTVSGLIKLIYPNGRVEKAQLEELLRFAMEGRRRVKEQLRRIGGFEFRDIEFLYTDSESGEDHAVRVPEELDPAEA
jgi:ATP-dependent Lon protease